MHKKIALLLFVSFLSFAMEDDGVHLVVGSIRNTNLIDVFPNAQLWREEKADLTYRNKDVVTMDLRECSISGKEHIVGDATNYLFKKDSIKCVYIERLPTLKLSRSSRALEELVGGINYLGDCICNIAQGMKKGAIMEIEWSPYLGFVDRPLSSIQSIYDQGCMKKSPFTTSIDAKVAFNAVKMNYKTILFGSHVTKEFIGCVSTLSEKIKERIAFYVSKNVGSKELLENRLDQEIWLLTELLHKNLKVLLPVGPWESLQKFSENIKNVAFISAHRPIIVGEWTNIVGKPHLSGIVYDASLFLSESFLNFILCDASIEYNTPYVKEFMQQNGFENITVTRQRSDWNGRENVVIVKAIKK